MKNIKVVAGFFASLFVLWTGYNIWPLYSVFLSVIAIITGLIGFIWYTLRVSSIVMGKA